MARIVRKRKSVEPPKTLLAALMEKHLEDLRLKNYSEYTIKGRRLHIGFFLDWAFERGITELQQRSAQSVHRPAHGICCRNLQF